MYVDSNFKMFFIQKRMKLMNSMKNKRRSKVTRIIKKNMEKMKKL